MSLKVEGNMRDIKEKIKKELIYVESIELLVFIEAMLKEHNRLNKKSS